MLDVPVVISKNYKGIELMYSISTFIGDQSNTENSEILEYSTFEALAKTFAVCRKGRKHSGYFTRGVCNGKRMDKNIPESKLLILDADCAPDDSNAPSPKDIHNALIGNNINHFIYTSHSHGKDQNKFRVVIPLSRPIVKKELRRLVVEACDLLDSWDLSIKRVKEMGTWSQPWFAPTRDNPEDGLFEYYQFVKGNEWHVKESKAEDAEATAESVSQEHNGSGGEPDNGDGPAETLGALYSNITSGKEYHESILNITWQLSKDGMSKAHIVALVQGLIAASPEFGSKRGQERYNDVGRTVQGALNKLNESSEIDVSNIKIEEEVDSYAPPPMPHGMLGKLISETKEFMLYKDDTIAFVSSMFILSSICGRKFNVDIHNEEGLAKPTALNMYFTLAAETGVGKSEIEDAVENCYFQFAGTNSAVRDFFYKGRVSGPRALYRIYKDQRSVGIIANEAGIEGQSTLGDHTGLRSAWLNLYGQGAWKKWTGASELSDSDNSIKSVRAVAISRVSESTPVELTKYYRLGNSVENGLIPRENIFVIKHLNEDPNENIRLSYSQDIKDRMLDLIQTCHSDVREDVLFSPYIITVKDQSLLNEMINTQRHYRHLQNTAESIHARAMSGRMFVKMLRYAGLITAFNKTKDDPNALVLEMADWEWAKKVVQDEYSKISDVVALTSGSDVMDSLIDYVCNRAVMILNGDIKNQELRIEPRLAKLGLIPSSKLKKACRTNSMLKELEGDPRYGAHYRSGWDKVVGYLEKIEYIEILSSSPHCRGTVIKIKDNLIAHMEGQ